MSAGRFPQVDQLIERLTRFEQPFKVTYEAGCGYGRFHELLTPIAANVAVAHPGLLKIIYGPHRSGLAVGAPRRSDRPGGWCRPRLAQQPPTAAAGNN